MEIIKIENRSRILLEQLIEIWEKSVRETHSFLSSQEIAEIGKYVPQALNDVPHLIIAENDRKMPVAFMGIAGQKLEMLFIHPSEQKQGLGKKLMQYAMKEYAVNELTVNEQNLYARKFYECTGFQVYKRTQRDEQGNPYPLLFMRLI
ncbi:MAG: GNAT family N-acetyltransferase [Alistipes senegalensis]|nr:GNAT family N-acetyltransferase [Oxalobacter formigenes]MCM1280995.1 GNAT family N-acetyltransferase [Alistipes senegalensis]